MSNNGVKTKGKVFRTFSFSPFWGSMFLIGLVVNFFIIANSPPEQMGVPAVLLMFALVSLITSFVIRFFLWRRQLNVFLALAFSFPLALMILVIGSLGGSPIAALAFVFFPFFILRGTNLSLEIDNGKEDDKEMWEPAVSSRAVFWVVLGFIAVTIALAMVFPQ